MPERALWPQLIKQVLCALKRIGSEIAILKQTSPAPRNFAFCQQGNAPFLIETMCEKNCLPTYYLCSRSRQQVHCSILGNSV